MTQTGTAEEVAWLGDEVQERVISPTVGADHHGEHVTLDVVSGCRRISDDLRD